MKLSLKNLKEQVIVITGATSGIGLVTARAASCYGAKLVLAARDGQALKQLADEIVEGGGEAIFVVADVGNEQDVRRIADAAVERFGGFDTWINNAGVSVYGKIEDVSIEDHRRLFETNFWGVVYGSRIAAAHLRGRGGALINVGSVVSDRAIPLQGMYSASKHAVKGFTDALRMELENDNAPVSVTLIKPAAIDTPYALHAKNYLEVEPRNAPPVYAPEPVANAILYAAEHPIRDIVVGGSGQIMITGGKLAPRLTDRIMEWTMFKAQRTQRPAQPRLDSLHAPSRDLLERGGPDGHVCESSLYTSARLHPLTTLVLLIGAGVVIAGAWQALSDEQHRRAIADHAREYASRAIRGARELLSA